MKKLLAIVLSLVMAFSVVALPASAVAETASQVNIESVEETVEKGFSVLEAIYNFVHNIVHTLSNMFDFDCPFCDDEADVEEPAEPEEIFGTISNAEEFSNVLSVGGTYTVEASVEMDSIEVPLNTKINLDLGGNTISGAPINNEGELAITGGTVNSAAEGIDNIGGKVALTDVDMNAGSTANYALIGRADSVTVCNNVDIKSAGGGIGVADGAELVFESGSVDVSTASTSGRYNFYAEGEGTKITINGGTFSFSKTLNQKRAYIYAGAGTTVIVNGGTFGPASTRSGYTAGILGDGTVIIKGGTFGFNPSTWVAEGYEAVKDGSVWTVAVAG